MVQVQELLKKIKLEDKNLNTINSLKMFSNQEPPFQTHHNILPSSRVFSLVQFVLSFNRPRLKCGWSVARPVSKMATFTPAPTKHRAIDT